MVRTPMHGDVDSKPKPHLEEFAGGCDLQTNQSTASTRKFFGPSTEFVSEGPTMQNSKRSCLILEFFLAAAGYLEHVETQASE